MLKTAFHIRYSDFEYLMMLFGLSKAPSNIQGYMNKILAEKLNLPVIIYPNNIWIYTNKADYVYDIWLLFD